MTDIANRAQWAVRTPIPRHRIFSCPESSVIVRDRRVPGAVALLAKTFGQLQELLAPIDCLKSAGDGSFRRLGGFQAAH